MVSLYCLAVYLAINTISDIRKRKIRLGISLLFLIIGVLWQIWQRADKVELLLAMLPGICLIGLSVMTQQKIGFGDGVVIVVCGIYLGLGNTILLLMVSLMLSALTGVVMLLLKKASLHTELPWITFVFVSFLGFLMSGQ